MLSTGAPYLLRDRGMADPSLVGQTMTISAPLADPIDQFHKGIIPRDVPEDQRRVSDAQIGYYDQLVASGLISAPFNWTLFTAAASRFTARAGLADRQRVVQGKSVSVRVDLGGSRIIKKKKKR